MPLDSQNKLTLSKLLELSQHLSENGIPFTLKVNPVGLFSFSLESRQKLTPPKDKKSKKVSQNLLMSANFIM